MSESTTESAIFLGIDTGGTYTDAVLWSEQRGVIAKAKSLTTRHDLSVGISGAVERIIAEASVASRRHTACFHVDDACHQCTCRGARRPHRTRHGRLLAKPIWKRPILAQPSDLIPSSSFPVDMTSMAGRSHSIRAALSEALPRLKQEVTGFAVCAYFAVRNPEHEIAVRDLVRRETGLPVTCSHELSAKLNGPRRALTTVLNARLIAMIDRLVAATEGFLDRSGIHAPLMVVRGDGALVSAAFARHRPIETILSGPAASLVGARHMTGLDNAIVSDIGGTTTDVAVLDKGRPRLDPNGATVGGFRTMVEAVAMHTFGLGGDSEVSLDDNAMVPGIKLGPRRLVPLVAACRQSWLIGHRPSDAASKSRQCRPIGWAFCASYRCSGANGIRFEQK